jgi:RNA polymerase II elongation factor ELL
VKKRLLAKDPQKARAAEDAKEKKRKEREAAASDREGGKPAKKQATKKANVKSEEFVHSSDDESDDEPIKPKAAQRIQSSPEKEKAKPAPKAKPKAVSSTTSDSSDTALKDKVAARSSAKPKPPPRAADSPETKAKKPTTTGKATPQAPNNLSAPNSQQRTQRSPSNPGNRPSVPSPLGAARPRVASDVSDRAAVGVQKVRQGADTPKGLGITNGVKKTQENAAKAESATSNKTSKKSDDSTSNEKLQKGSANGSGTPKPLVNGAEHQANGGVKRKAEDSEFQQEGGSMAKHRKTESVSSQVHKSQSKPNSTPNGTDHISSEGIFDPGSGSDTVDVDSVLESITFNQGVKMAENFRKYYAAYDKEYEAQQATEAKGETVSREDRLKLLEMHKRLERMKQEINAASQREGL